MGIQQFLTSFVSSKIAMLPVFHFGNYMEELVKIDTKKNILNLCQDEEQGVFVEILWSRFSKAKNKTKAEELRYLIQACFIYDDKGKKRVAGFIEDRYTNPIYYEIVFAIFAKFMKRKDFDDLLNQNLHCENYKMFLETDQRTQVDTAQSLIAFIECLHKHLALKEAHASLFYRGHDNINYKVIPSLFRDQRWITNEAYMCNQMLMRKTLDFKHCHNNFERLVLMQHYALPTRLLDITSNPLVALYFACQDDKMDGCIHLYCEAESAIKYGESDSVRIASAFSKLTYDEQQEVLDVQHDKDEQLEKLASEIATEKSGFKNHILVKDLHNVHIVHAKYQDNERIIRQAGLFIICSDVHSVAQELYELTYKIKKKAIMIHIPAYAKKGIREMLGHLDINDATMYLDMDKVSWYIKTHV